MATKKRDRSYKGRNNPELVKARQDAFLAAYGECGSIRAACDASDVGRSTIDEWRRNDAHSFREKFTTANEIFREMLQDMAIERVKNQKPNDNPVLLITLLNANWKEKYARNGQDGTSEMKEIMVEWKKWVKKNNNPSKENPGITEEDAARSNAIYEVEKILSRKRDSNDNSS